MHPLVYLSVRSFINAVRNALTSGKRLVTILFAAAYYGWLVFRPIGSSTRPLSFNAGLIASPAVADAMVFAGFALMTLLLMMTLTSPRGGFSQADVDVLFATPINPRVVMLYRMFRDYVATLISPFLLALFGGRVSYAFAKLLFGNMGGDGPLAMRLGLLAWFLTALAWVCIGYGIGFLINRSDLRADRNKRLLDIGLVVVIAGTVLFVVLRLMRDLSVNTAVGLAEAPLIRTVFFTATAACWVVTGALRGELVHVGIGLAILLALSAAGICLALSQLDMMYDQAAAKGFGAAERRMLRRNSDLYGLAAQRARDGRPRIGWMSRWVGGIRATGVRALLWKDILLQLRSSPMLSLTAGGLMLFMTVPLLFAAPRTLNSARALSVSIFFIQALGVLMLTMNSAAAGYIELLKRVDFQKPLPFRPAGTVLWEVAAKCVPNILVARDRQRRRLRFAPGLVANCRRIRIPRSRHVSCRFLHRVLRYDRIP